MEPDPPINDESVDDGPDVEEQSQPSDDDGSSPEHIEGE